MSHQSVTLRSTRDRLGTRQLSASLADDGTLSIEGHDFGDGVEQVFGTGNRQYEWTWTLSPSEVARLLSVLESGEDVLTALTERFSADAAAELQPFLDEHGVRYQQWSRIGE